MRLLRKNTIFVAYLPETAEIPIVGGEYSVMKLRRGQVEEVMESLSGDQVNRLEDMEIPESYGKGSWKSTELNGYLIYRNTEIKTFRKGEVYGIKIYDPADLLVRFSMITRKKIAKITLEDILNLTIDDLILRLAGILVERTT